MSEERKETNAQQESQGASDTVPANKYEEAIERARRFEAQLEDTERQLNKFKGVDLDKYNQVLQEYETLRKDRAQGDPEEIDRLLQEKELEFEKRFSSKIEELETKASTYEQELKELRVTSVVMGRAGEFVQPNSIALLKPFVEKHCEYHDGRVIVKDDKGQPRYSPTNPRELMTTEEFLSEFAENYGIGVDRTRRGTLTGAPQSGGAGRYGSISVDRFLSMTEEERRELPADVRARLGDEVLGRRPQQRHKNAALGN